MPGQGGTGGTAPPAGVTTGRQSARQTLTGPAAPSLRDEGEERVQVVEAPGHDALVGVAEVPGVAQLVEDTAQAGGHAAPHRPAVAAVVHAEAGVHRAGVDQPGLDTGQAGGPRPHTASPEESEAAPAQGNVALGHLERGAVAEWFDPPGVVVPRAGQEGQVLHLLVTQAGGEQLPPDGLPQLVRRQPVGLLSCEGSLVDVNHGLSSLFLTLNTEQSTWYFIHLYQRVFSPWKWRP